MTTAIAIRPRKSLEPWIKDDVEYYPHQIEGVRTLARRKSFLLGDDMGLGKAQPTDEPILTPEGWVEMGSLSVGDQIIGLDGLPVKVLAIHERGERIAMKVTFSDASWVRCDPDHLWAVTTPVRKYRNQSGLVLSTRELLNRGLQHANGNNKFYLPVIAPVEFAPVINNLDAYLIGVLLGDGSLSQTSVHLDTDAEIVENLKLPWDCAAMFCGMKSEYTGSYRLNGLAKYLRVLDMMDKRSEDKFIPTGYKYGSVEERIAVLQGLIDTDGTAVQSRGKSATTIEYGTVSKQLSEDVDHIVRSLGGLTSVSLKYPTFTYKGEKKEGQPFYRMVIRLPGWIKPFRLNRKAEKWTDRSKYEPTRAIVSIEPDGTAEMRCITVDSPQSIYITRNFTPTHNSLQAMTVFAVDVVRDWAKTALVICPTTLKGNWADEIEKFTRFPYVILEGSPKKRERQLIEFASISGPKILITNYEQIKLHLDILNKLNFDVAIFDEAHYLKNSKAQRTKACLALYSRRSFLLTGTPMLNHVNELWPLLHRIDPEAWPKYWQFVSRYCVFGGFKDKQIIGPKNEAELTERVQNVMLRRMKSEVLDLPDVQIIERRVDLLPEQQKLYDEVIQDMKLPKVGEADPMDIENALVKFLRLKQICGTTLPFTGEDISAKLNLAEEDDLEILDNGHKIVVWTQFRDVLTAYSDRMKRYDLPIFQIHGDVMVADRQPIVKEWGLTKEPGLLICMLQVAGVGLNMTQSRHGSFLDELFVPGLNQQAIDRQNRIGADATQPIQIRKYICRNTIENRVQQILRTKSKLFGEIIETDPSWKRKLYEALTEDE